MWRASRRKCRSNWRPSRWRSSGATRGLLSGASPSARVSGRRYGRREPGESPSRGGARSLRETASPPRSPNLITALRTQLRLDPGAFRPRQRGPRHRASPRGALRAGSLLETSPSRSGEHMSQRWAPSRGPAGPTFALRRASGSRSANRSLASLSSANSSRVPVRSRLCRSNALCG